MILLQASIIWSAGVVSVVQSGPSWLRACAKAGADHRVGASRQSATSRRRIGGCPIEERRLFVARQTMMVHGLAVVHTANEAGGPIPIPLVGRFCYEALPNPSAHRVPLHEE